MSELEFNRGKLDAAYISAHQGINILYIEYGGVIPPARSEEYERLKKERRAASYCILSLNYPDPGPYLIMYGDSGPTVLRRSMLEEAQMSVEDIVGKDGMIGLDYDIVPMFHQN